MSNRSARMGNVLDFYAHTHAPFLHARGARSTAFLLEKIAVKPGDRVLEIGFGTGQTLVELRCRLKGVEIFGLEKSHEMLRVAAQRLKFCDVGGIELLPANAPFPFPDNFFSVVVVESVLSILSDEELDRILPEIHRVLDPGGNFYLNESLWRSEITQERIQAINRQCRAAFGIQQASEKFPYSDDWQNLLESQGFLIKEKIALDSISAKISWIWDFRIFKSWIFSRVGNLKTWRDSRLRVTQKNIGQQAKLLADGPPYLEGIFFHCQKPG